MTPFQRGGPSCGEQQRAHRRTDAVRGHQHVAVHRIGRLPVAVDEQRPHPVRVLLDTGQPVPGVDGAGAEPFPHGAEQDALQPAAVQGELGERETGVQAAGPAQDLGPEPVGIGQLRGADPHLVEPVEQAHTGELPHGVRQHVDPDTQLPDPGAAFVDLAVDALVVQSQCGGQATDPRPDDHDLHHRSPVATPRRHRTVERIGRARVHLWDTSPVRPRE